VLVLWRTYMGQVTATLRRITVNKMHRRSRTPFGSTTESDDAKGTVPRQTVVVGRFPAGTDVRAAAREVLHEGAPDLFPQRESHRTRCGGIWGLWTDPSRSLAQGFRFVTCHRCAQSALSVAAWARIDYEAACQALDPDGVMRAFLDASDLAPVIPEPHRLPPSA
jgi:hypothetical protein